MSAGAWLIILLYLLPIFVAFCRHHPNRWSVWVINIFLGWTGVGWVLALAIACSRVRPRRRAGDRNRPGDDLG